MRPEARLLDGRFWAGDPHPALQWMREHEPVYRDDDGDVWGITRHADVTEVSRHPELFCSRHGSRPDAPVLPSMINLDDPQHLRRRNLVNRGFTPRRVAGHETFLRETCRGLIDAALQHDRFDFVAEIAREIPMRMIGRMLGVAPEDHDRLLRWSDDFLISLSASASPELTARAAASFAEWTEFARRTIDDRRASGRTEDLIGALVHAQIDGDRLSDDELLHESLLILVGGDETTRHVLSGGMLALLQHPEQQRHLAVHPDAIPRAVEEMLRWVTPIQNMSRTATRDVELCGRRIREGDRLLLLYPSANRDASVFVRPFDFDARRHPNDHVAFGGRGTHHCLGASLARLELRLFFEEWLARPRDVVLAPDEATERRPSNFIVGLERLVLDRRD